MSGYMVKLFSFQSFSNTLSTTTTDKPEKDEKDPYGKWSGGDMKLTAVPFSRAEDGNNRKWVLMTRYVLTNPLSF
jgi:hypothetical protein